MAQLKDLLRHIQLVTAGRGRDCRHNKRHRISKGDLLVEVKEAAFKSPRGYCRTCALEMLEEASLKLVSIKGRLGQ